MSHLKRECLVRKHLFSFHFSWLRICILLTVLLMIILFNKKSSASNDCLCWDSYGFPHDFCYRNPANKTSLGKKFSCKHASYLEKLDLLNRNYEENITTNKGITVFVTAFSQNHYLEGRRLIASVRKFWKSAKVIVYDLGLSKRNSEKIKSLCNVEYRIFHFHDFPDYFKDLTTFRWKPIIIADVLREFNSFWYLDTSVYLTKENLDHVYSLTTCTKAERFVPPLTEVRDLREARTKHELPWNTVRWTADVAECFKSRYLLHSFTGHGIAAATDPALYAYFPTNMNELTKEKAKMYEAGLVYIQKDDTVKEIVKWYVLCALEYDCMRSTLQPNFCRFGQDKTFAGCHRYDQSVINLLLANKFYYDRIYYTSGITDFFQIQRFVNKTVRGRELKCEL